MAVARFTEAWVEKAPPGQYTDETLRGFMCVVGKTRTTWYAQAVVRGGRQTKVRVGHWPDVPQVKARDLAREALSRPRAGRRRAASEGAVDHARRGPGGAPGRA